MEPLLLIDLSSIAYPIFIQSQASDSPDLNAAATGIVDRIRALSGDLKRVAICRDVGRSFRVDIDPSYKANRQEKDIALGVQIQLACDRLSGEGFPIWSAEGFEADDVIATATKQELERSPDASVVIVTADKDLHALISDRVRVKSVRNGSIVDVQAVKDAYGLEPSQIPDYLTLMGDAADNIVGAKGIGSKKASALLQTFGSIDDIYRRLRDEGYAAMNLPVGLAKSLTDFEPRWELVRSLVTMRTDAPISVSDCDAPRTNTATAPLPDGWSVSAMASATSGPQQSALEAVPEAVVTPERVVITPQLVTDIPSESEALELVPHRDALSWERQLDPRSMPEAQQLAMDMFKARMFSGYGGPEGVLSTIMLGRELGMPALSALRSIHIVEGKHALSSAAMVALVLKSGLAEYFDALSFDMDHATFETKRKGASIPVKLTYTIEMARVAGLVRANSPWMKHPMAMCIARAQAMLARLVYSDVLASLYSPEEIAENRALAVAPSMSGDSHGSH